MAAKEGNEKPITLRAVHNHTRKILKSSLIDVTVHKEFHFKRNLVNESSFFNLLLLTALTLPVNQRFQSSGENKVKRTRNVM